MTNLTTAEKLEKALNSLGIDELKHCAILYKDETSTQGIIIADKINSKLIELMPAGDFAKFAETELI